LHQAGRDSREDVTMTEKPDEVYTKAIAEQRRREFYAARERVLRGEGGPGEFAEEVDGVIVDENGVPKAAIKYETGAGWVDSAEDHAGEN
jgi:hypothetical protein